MDNTSLKVNNSNFSNLLLQHNCRRNQILKRKNDTEFFCSNVYKVSISKLRRDSVEVNKCN